MRFLIIGAIVLIILGLFFIGTALFLGLTGTIPPGGTRWTGPIIATLVLGIIFVLIGIALIIVDYVKE